MKKFICCLLCLSIMTVIASAAFAAVSYTLPEKMEKQLSIGSGLKGSLTITAEGSDPLLLSLEPFSGVEMQVRGIKSGEDWHVYLYQAGENESQKGLTELYGKDGMFYARSDMLPGQVFSMPSMIETVDRLIAKEGGNPPFVSMLLSFLSLNGETRDERWEPLAEQLIGMLEIWIADYAYTSELTEENAGTKRIELTYTIPTADLSREIVSLLAFLRTDSEAKTLLESIMTEEQKAFYLNEYLDYFFLDAMSALRYDYDVFMKRVVSPLGDEISSLIELPLDESRFGGYNTLTVSRENGVSGITLLGGEKNLRLVTDGDLSLESLTSGKFWIMTWPDAEPGNDDSFISSRVEIEKQSETHTDEDSRDHQNDHWTIRILRDTSRLPEEADPSIYSDSQPITFELSLNYTSKYSQSSPTTLDVEARLEKENLLLQVSGQFKTASPWVFSPFDTENARDVLSLTEDEKNLLLAEWLASAGEQLEKK